MADNYLITGYRGEPHVTAENDRGIHAATFGVGRFVLPVGEQFKAEYIGNNTVRMYDGKLVDNGAVAGIPAGEYVDLLISNAGQGMKRNDIIIFRYRKNNSTSIEYGDFIVLQGTETAGTATDPTLKHTNLLTDAAVLDHMALWRVSVSGTTIAAPEKMFSLTKHPQTIRVSTAGTNLDDYTDEGTYYFSSDYTPVNAPAGVNGWLDVKAVSSDTFKQIWWRFGTPGSTDRDVLFRTCAPSTGCGDWVRIITDKTVSITVDGGFGNETEWIKPPMILGTEYRTTERYRNKPVYTKVVDCGKPVAPTDSLTGVNLGDFIDTIIRDCANVDGKPIERCSYADLEISYIMGNHVRVTTSNVDNNHGNAYVQAWYTKA